MESTLNSLLIIILTILPGVPGEFSYNVITGFDWRENRWQRAVRTGAFSVIALILYILLDDFIGAFCRLIFTSTFVDLPDPVYILPHYLSTDVTRESLSTMSQAFTGHFILSAFLGAGFGYIRPKIDDWGSLVKDKMDRASGYPSTWDALVNEYAKRHWVIVTLKDGTTYAGMIELAEKNVGSNERDLLLEEPALYDTEQDNYIAEPYQHIYFPSALISTVAVVHNREEDDRSTTIGEPVFHQNSNGDTNE